MKYWKWLFQTQTQKDFFSIIDENIDKFIPYKAHWNHNTILLKDNSLLQVLRLEGISFETIEDEELNFKKQLCNSIYKNITSDNIILNFYIIRRKKPMTQRHTKHSVIKHDFANYVNDEWHKKYDEHNTYFNDLYITITHTQSQEGAEFITYLYKKILNRSNKKYWMENMKEKANHLNEISLRIINALKDYNIELLGIKKNNIGYRCEMLEFLSLFVNAISTDVILLNKASSITENITQSRLVFKSEHIKIISLAGNKYAAMVSLKEYSPHTYPGMLNGLLHLPCELILSQSFKFSNKSIAMSKMQLQQARMIQAEDQAVSQIQEISEALDLAMSGEIGFGHHHMSIMCIEDNLRALKNAVSLVMVELSNIGIVPVKEGINMEPVFWGQLPGNLDYIVRKSIIHTLNLSSYASMHNFPKGKMYDNFWGEYVTILQTTSSTPYYFNFHVNDVGHTLIIGPTGAGKTVLMNFLCAQALKFKPHMFFFDKEHGAELFIRAIGGIYNDINPGKNCNMNPLRLPDTTANRNFLLDWLKSLVSINNEQITSSEIQILSDAIEGNYRLDYSDRILSNIVPFLGLAKDNSLANRIAIWCGTGSKAKVFDNYVDTIDFSKGNVFGFEMSHLLADKVSLLPVLLYLFHRINISLDGYPTIIVLDEAWALIDNPVFGPRLKNWLKVLRKLNTFVIFATQSVEDATGSDISATLIQQTATQIFLPNMKASPIYKNIFMLNDREYHIIKTTNVSTRYFILKQGLHSVIAKIDLHGMDKIIAILSGRSSSVKLLNKIIKKHGDDPEKWLPIFYQKIS